MPSDRKMIGLRLDEETYGEVAGIATRELRSISNMVEILLRTGLRDYKTRTHQSPSDVADRLAVGYEQMDIGEQIARKAEAGPARKKK